MLDLLTNPNSITGDVFDAMEDDLGEDGSHEGDDEEEIVPTLPEVSCLASLSHLIFFHTGLFQCHPAFRCKNQVRWRVSNFFCVCRAEVRGTS